MHTQTIICHFVVCNHLNDIFNRPTQLYGHTWTLVHRLHTNISQSHIHKSRDTYSSCQSILLARNACPMMLWIYTHTAHSHHHRQCFVGIKLEQLIQAMEISISNRISQECERVGELEWEHTRLIISVANALEQTNNEWIIAIASQIIFVDLFHFRNEQKWKCNEHKFYRIYLEQSAVAAARFLLACFFFILIQWNSNDFPLWYATLIRTRLCVCEARATNSFYIESEHKATHFK